MKPNPSVGLVGLFITINICTDLLIFDLWNFYKTVDRFIAQKVKFSTKNFFSKYEQTVDLLTFIREILTGKTLFFVQ